MKKTLIITGIPFRNDSNLGKTLSTLFAKFSPEELVQLYFSPQRPNVKNCSSYYQINEKQLIRSLFGLVRKKCGCVINANDIKEQYAVAETNPAAFISIRDFILVPIFRDLLWLVSKWRNQKLDKWLNTLQPDVIFATLPGSVKSCKIIKYIACHFDCPIVLFVTDDYYHDPKLKSGFLRKWYFRWIQRSIDDMAKRVKYVVGCSDLAAKEFGKKYGVGYEAILTPSGADFLAMKEKEQKDTHPVVFRYFGNLGLERWKPLAELGKAIFSYNGGEQKAILEVYSNLMYPDAIAQLDIPNGCVFKGWVHDEEFLRLLQDADVAVHVESFSEEMCRRTRLSISTKIADYLGAGKCILAIGRDDLASIQHLSQVAEVVGKFEQLQNSVKRLVEDSSLRSNLSERARQLAIENHDNQTIATRVKEIIQECKAK